MCAHLHNIFPASYQISTTSPMTSTCHQKLYIALVLLHTCYFNFENGDNFDFPVPLRCSQCRHITSSAPPPPAVAITPKGKYDRNAPLKQRHIPTHKEVQAEIGSEVGEVMDFLIANDIVTAPECCEQCGHGYAYSWKDHKMRAV